MSILFYDHLVKKDEVWLYIEKIEGPEQHKNRLKRMVDDIVHQGVLELILQKLEPHHHERFLRLVTNAPYDPLVLEFLKKHAGENIELEIETAGHNILNDVMDDLHKG